MTRIRVLVASLLLACLGSAVQAHQLWIENEGKQVHLYFGEYDSNLRETSPGRLDEFIGVSTMEQGGVSSKTAAVTGVELTPDYFNANSVFM